MKRDVFSKRLVLVLVFFVLFFVGCGEEVDKCENINCSAWQECSEGKCSAKDDRCDFDNECGSEELCNIFTNYCEEKCTTGESKCVDNKSVLCVNSLWQETECSVDQICRVSNSKAICTDKMKLKCRELLVDLHVTESNKIDLTTYSITTSDKCDIVIEKSSEGPRITLCEDTLAYNNGNSTSFVEITEAPTEAHIGDNPPDYVIGTSWRTGDSGETGFTMTRNIYTIKRSDNSYGKLEVLLSMAGKVRVYLYADPNGGNDLSCIE